MTTASGQSLAALARALRDGELSAAALLEAAQGNRDPELGAYLTWAPEVATRAAAAADAAFRAGADVGPLQGIPVAVKDIFGVAGLPTYAGSPERLPARWETQGPIVDTVRRQLGVITGKTHSVEFAFGGLGTNAHWPTPRNPRDRAAHRVPGGSSSGAGVSLVEGSALLALGTDTAGSVRIPASMTGVAGLKTTKGRWSTDGIVPLSTSLDTPGVLARSAGDLAFAFAAFEGAEVPRPATAADLRIGVPERFFWDDLAPGVGECVRAALARLERAGARLVKHELPGVAEAYDIFRVGGLAAAELYRFLSQELPERLETLDPNVRGRMPDAEQLKAWEYLQRREMLQTYGREAAQAFWDVDVVATPSVPNTPPLVSAVSASGDVYKRENMLALRNTSVVNALGLAATTISAGVDDASMPVGLQLIGAPFQEERLIAVTCGVEAVLGPAGA